MTDTTPTPADRPADGRTTWSTAEPLQQAADLRRAAGDPLLADWLDATANALAWLAPYRDNEPGYGMWEAALAVARQLLGTSTAESDRRCVCGDPIEWMTHPDGPGWIHSPGSDTRCLDARPAAAPPAPAAAPLAEVWTVWREDEPVYAHYTTEEAARQGTIDCWQEDEPSCPDYSWRQDGPRLELVVGGEFGGVYASRHRVYGAQPAPADRAAVLREAVEVAGQMGGRFGTDDHGDIDTGWNDACEAVAAELRRLAADAVAGVQPPTSEAELTATLVINRTDSYCDGCRKPTLPRNTHHTDISGWTPVPGGGCGARFVATRSDYRDITADDLKDVRPDLPVATPPAAPAAPEEPTWVGATELASDREIARVAATGVVGYRQNKGRLHHCLAHKPAPASRFADFHEVGADDLDDGGICVHPDCGRDLLAAWPTTRAPEEPTR
ncbi:hypothetical protein [Streptomyces parvus]|uniref:hypothetical protein n=1 Tax=Streptomyces parvus TaxID=66428 RepID=UPI003405F15E